MKRIGVTLMLIALLGLCGCADGLPESSSGGLPSGNWIPDKMPEDFSFALQWNTHGISSYDSKTGLLIKTWDVVERTPEEYQAMLVLPEETLTDIYGLLRDLCLESYPERFVCNPQLGCDPPMTLGITVRWSGGEKTVVCTDVASYEDATAPLRSQRFLTAHRQMTDILTATPEWEALPEYEVYYE